MIFHPYQFCFNAHLVSEHLVARSLSLDIQAAQDRHSEVWSDHNDLGNTEDMECRILHCGKYLLLDYSCHNPVIKTETCFKTLVPPLCLAEVQDHRGGENRCQTRSRRRGRKP